MKRLHFSLLLFFLLLLSACSTRKFPVPAAGTEASSIIMVKTAAVDCENYSRPIHSTGLIGSDVESRLSFNIGGIVDRLYVKEGDLVKTGQLLASLNQTEAVAQLRQAEDLVEKTARDDRRITTLYKDSSATLEEFENTHTALSTARQSLSIARFNKEHSNIYANQSGYVLKKLMNEGEIAGPGATVYLINSAANQDWVIKLGLSDRDWSRVRAGDHAVVVMDAFPGKTFDAVLSEIGKEADPLTGTFPAKLKIRPGSTLLGNGLAAKVTIQPSGTEKVCFIPVDALVEASGLTGNIYTLQPDSVSVRRHTVQIAFMEGNKVAVSSGLEGIDAVITDGSAYLTPGTAVTTRATKD
jgi:membrane fusion protein, multidrug efflux system